VTDSHGDEFWYSHGRLHRYDGPSVYESDVFGVPNIY
jgi:hypothetical protein